MEKYLDELKKEFEEIRKRDLEKARRVATSIIPSIKQDLEDASLEITVEDLECGGIVTGPKSFSLCYIHFLYEPPLRDTSYDDILALSQHEKMHLDRKFPETVMKEVMVDRAAAERFGPYALFSFHCNSVLSGSFTSAWLYHLGSLVNIKDLLKHDSQKRFVEHALKTHYPKMLEDMLGIINFKVPKGKIYVSRKLGKLNITPKVQEELDNLFSEFIRGLSLKRKHIEYVVNKPFSPVGEKPVAYIKDYRKLEYALLLK